MKRKQHITAFYLETLLLIVVFISIILVLTRVFGRARVQSVEAKRLTAAVTLAQNTAEAVSASGSPQDLLDLLNEKNNAVLQSADAADDPASTVITALYDEDLQPVPEIRPGSLIVETQWGASAPSDADPETIDPEAGQNLVNVTIRVYSADRTTEIYSLDTAVYAPADA